MNEAMKEESDRYTRMHRSTRKTEAATKDKAQLVNV